VTGFLAWVLLGLGSQELVAAARAGDGTRVEALLSSGAKVDQQDERGSTALMFAALRGDAKMVHALLSANADPNLRDANGESALLLGAARGAEVVSALLAAGADPNLADAEGETPLLVAAAGHEESVRLLIEAGADVHHQDQFGVSALTVAEAAGASRIAELLQAAGASGNPADRLHAAVRDNDQETVQRLVAEGADVNGLDTDRYETPLLTAVRHRRLDLIVLLLEAGADPAKEANGYDNAGESAIEAAARENSPWALRAFLEALPARARQQDRDAALLAGCAHPAIVRVALEEGAKANAKGERGITALTCAAAAGALDSVALLLAAGADPTARAEDGSTALGRALEGGHQEMAELLKKALER
jgi:ankyrin repeat protein